MRRRRMLAEINVVPYIDVMLVLLVIFMVTAPMLMQGVEVELPKADAAPVEDQDAEPLIVSIDSQGQLFLNLGANEKQVLELATVRERVAAVLRRTPDKPVLVWGDQNVAYGDVVVVMTAHCRRRVRRRWVWSPRAPQSTDVSRSSAFAGLPAILTLLLHGGVALVLVVRSTHSEQVVAAAPPLSRSRRRWCRRMT